MSVLATIDQAKVVFAGRNVDMYNFLNDNYSNSEWNNFKTEYEGIETDITNGDVYGIVPAPVRPVPPTRP